MAVPPRSGTIQGHVDLVGELRARPDQKRRERAVEACDWAEHDFDWSLVAVEERELGVHAAVVDAGARVELQHLALLAVYPAVDAQQPDLRARDLLAHAAGNAA